MSSPADFTSPNLSRKMQVRKPATVSQGGIVVTQNRVAAEAGARVLKAGGHAVDAIVAAAFAIGVAEPWMSGIGGVGAMLIMDGKTGKVTGFDFGGRSPKALKISDFELTAGADADLFGWPSVKGAVNTKGPKAVVVPSQPLGLWTAHRAFGRKPWAQLLEPAIALAGQGPVVDWHTTLIIATAMADLAADAGAAERFLRGGAPPVAQGPTMTAAPLRLPMQALAATLSVLAGEGAPALYRGRLAEGIAADIKAMGGYLSADDLASYAVRTVEPLVIRYGAHKVHVMPELNGGPTLAVAFDALSKIPRKPARKPSGADYVAYASALATAWDDRFRRLGDAGERSAPTCTTHMTAIDRDGNVVTLTQTLLSLFGSRIVLPTSGILMNNGINWFDPRPGGPNSLAPDRRVLANYVPAILESPAPLRNPVNGENSRSIMAIGGCGGRKIIPAVFQLLAMRADFGLGLGKLFETPRLDVSGGRHVVTDRRMPRATLAALERSFETALAEPLVYSNPYTMANGVLREGGVNYGMCEPLQPWCEAVSEDEV
ncbi:MAG: gamma-glutamyltransferase [Beijerinckiaceae bacterium]